MNWDSLKVIDREDHRFRRWVKESIHVRKLKDGTPMNRDKLSFSEEDSRGAVERLRSKLTALL